MEEEKDLTLKEVILSLLGYVKLLGKYWLILLVITSIGAVVGFYIAKTSPITYDAKTTFLVQEDDGGKANIGSSLSLLGLGGLGGGKQNYDKIMAIGLSRSVVYKVLLTPLENGQLPINMFIKEYELDDRVDTILISHPDSLNELSVANMGALNSIYSRLLKNDKLKISYDPKSAVLTSFIQSEDQNLSYQFNQNHYSEINSFYTNQVISKQKINVESLKKKVDSLTVIINSKSYQLASQFDKSNNMFFSQDKVSLAKLESEISISKTIFVELVKNYETSKYILASIKPTFTVLDPQYLPLSRKGKKWLNEMIKYGLIFGFLGALYIITKHIFSNVMK